MLSTQNQVLRLPMAMVLLTAILVCILVNDNKLPLSFKPDCMPKKLRVKMWVQKPLIPSLTYQLKKKMKINQVWKKEASQATLLRIEAVTFPVQV